MTHQQTRSHEQSRSASRRPGIIPGRRFALVLALAGAFLACWRGVAVADFPVVSATIYTGSSGGTTSQSVTVAQLQNCPLYTGPYAPAENPGGTYQLPQGSTWALSTVVTCGLKEPVNSDSRVQVLSTQNGWEAPLTYSELSTPSAFSDSSSQPVIANNGGQYPNTYFRPQRSATDNNAQDVVVEQGSPITISVFENKPPLTVTVPKPVLVSGTTYQFSASATDPGGAPVPASALSESWSFNYSGGTSTSAQPTYSFAPGNYAVTVVVTDTSTGLAGDGSVVLTVPGGGNTKTTPNSSPQGPKNGQGNSPGGGSGKPKGQPSGATGKHPMSKSSATGKTGQGTKSAHHPSGNTSGSGSSAAGRTVGHRASGSTSQSSRRSTSSARHRSTTTTAPPRLVAGNLISAVTPLPAGASPFVHRVPGATPAAPPVRSAAATSSSTALAAGLAVFLLFGLGAGRELRWRHAWRLPHFGS